MSNHRNNETSGLTNEQENSLISDMLDKNLLLDEYHEDVNYIRNCLKRLSDEMESTKKLLMNINSQISSCRKDQTGFNSTEDLNTL